MTNDQLVNTLSPLVSRVRTDVCWVKTPDGPSCLKTPLTAARIQKHVSSGPAFGAAFIHAGSSTTRVAAFDFDSHGGETPWADMQATAMRVFEELEFRGLAPAAFKSSGGRGIHLYVIWDEEQDAYSVRRLLVDVLKACDLKSGTAGVHLHQVEVFPKQDHVPADGFGNMMVLPLAGFSVPLDPTAGLADLPRDTPVAWQCSTPVPVLERPAPEQLPTPDPASFKELQALLAAIPDNSPRMAEYETWRNTMFAIHYTTDGSEEGRALAHAFSSRQPNYDPEMLDVKVWDYAGGNKDTIITDGFLKNLAAEHGHNPTTTDDFDDLGEAPAQEPRDKPRRFAPIPAAEFATVARPVHWHVHGILPSEGVSMVYGASASGKTFVVLDMAIAIARGEPWRGVRVHQGRVVYVVAESPGGFRKRLAAFAHQHDVALTDIDLHIIPAAPNILDKAHVKELIQELRLLGDVSMVVLDTLARVTAGGDENSAQDMGVAMDSAQRIVDATGGSVLLVHHSGKDAERGARGSSAIRAALDAELEVARSDEDRVLKVTKLKDGEEGAEYGFRLLTVLLGQDEEGEDVTSCVVEHNTASGAAVKRTKGLGPVEKVILRAVTDLAIGADGVVQEDAVVELAAEWLPEPQDGRRDRRVERVKRAIVGLIVSEHLVKHPGEGLALGGV